MSPRWLRFEDAKHLAKQTHDVMLVAELSKDIRGIYVADSLDRYKVFYDALERDSRGALHRRQRTRTFKIDDDYDIDGEQVDALTAARDFKSRRSVEVTLQREQAHDVTLDDVYALYVSTRQLRPATAHVYAYAYRKYISPTLGRWTLRNLDIHAVETWWNALEGTAPEARAKSGRLLRSLTAFALQRGMIASNPARVLNITSAGPRALRPDEIPTAEQVAALAEAVGERYSALIYLLAYGGVRIGEAVALKVDRIDFGRRRITIDASASEVGGALVSGPTKTGAGTRTFTAPAFLVDMLKAHAESYPTTTGLMFSGAEGGQLRPGNFRRRVFGPAAERAELEGLRLHDLRHTAASTLASQGASAVEIAGRLGHSSVATTQRVYLHLLASRDERLAELQDQAFARRGGPPL